jgi:hypothetical protein
LYSLPYIIRMIKWRKIRWAGHVAQKRQDEKYVQEFGWKA